MAKLILSLDGKVIREIPLAGQRITIGRKLHNQIVLDSRAVSGEHAILIRQQGEYLLEDRQSTNGTHVNGQAITRILLHHNDSIGIARYQLTYQQNPETLGKAGEFEDTILIAPMAPAPRRHLPDAVPYTATLQTSTSALRSMPLPPPPPPVANAPILPTARIRVINGKNAGRELEITKNFVTLGRQGVQVAVISRRPQGYCLTHVEGRRYPSINGLSIGTQAKPLTDQDVIELAGVSMRFMLDPDLPG
ncbi:FHA domain-containing protein [Leeia oryzae]|uniref:FHA domain-containing protein n=1 Tax=Leeia oryzae TaxID=356662 RepID=UPI00038015A2|nr:FHA domain-containing protein [Leeia oryzae]